MKKTNFIRLLVLIMVLVTSVSQTWAKTVYFKNTGNWTNVYCYYWGGSSNTWPGTKMTHLGGHYYSCDVSNASSCIFNNNDGTQTGDLTVQNGQVYVGQNGGWHSTFSADAYTIYFDRRNVTDWSNPHMRIGHGSYCAAYALSNVAGTKHLYSCTSPGWEDYTSYTIANSAGYTDDHTIYQPSDEKPSSPYAITKLINYQSGNILENKYITPSTKNKTEKDADYWNVTVGNTLPSYTVSFSSPTHGTLSVQKYTKTDGSTKSAISSGASVLPTQIVQLSTSSWSTGYELNSYSATNATRISDGLYYVTGNATFSASEKEKTYSVTVATANSTMGKVMTNKTSTTVTAKHFTSDCAITAHNEDGYHFVNWTKTGSVVIADATDESTTINATAASATVTANFAPNTISIILDDNGSYLGNGSASITFMDDDLTITSHARRTSWNVAGYWSASGNQQGVQVIDAAGNLIANVSGYTDEDGNWINSNDEVTLYADWSQTYSLDVEAGSGISSVSGSNADVTLNSKYAISATPLSGYTFSSWTASPSDNGVFDDASSASTNVTVKNGNVTVTGAATENMTTVTVNVSPTGWGTLTKDAAAFTAGNTVDVGVTTGYSMVATAADATKVFIEWEKTGNAAGTPSTNTFPLKGNGSSGTGTLTAKFGYHSGWALEGQDFGGWGGDNCSSLPTTYEFSRPYRGMANTYYVPVTLTADHYFKVHNGNGCSNVYNFGSNSGNVTVAKGTIYGLTVDASNSGKVSSTLSDIWAVINTSTKKFWVQDPQTFYNVNVSGNVDAKGPTKVTLKTTSAFTKGDNVFETTQFANGETFTVTVTGVSGWIPTITIGGETTTFWKEAASYSADGTMSTSDVVVTISYTASYAVTFATTTGGSTISAYQTGTPANTISTGNKVKSGTSITFTQTKAHNGYDFSSWNSESTGSGSDLGGSSSGVALSITAATSVYPIYTRHTFTGGTLDKKEGTLDGSYSVTYLATSITPSAPTKTGYQVSGYYKETERTNLIAEGNGNLKASTAYTNGDKQWNYTSSIPTLFAKWQAKTYAVTLNKNGTSSGYLTNGTATATYDSNKLTSITAPTRTGYHVDGYYSDDDYDDKVADDEGNLQASSAYTTAGSSWDEDANATLYTKWAANKYTVTLNAGEGGSGSGTMEIYYDAAAYDTWSHDIEQTGYHIAGWYDNGEKLKVLNDDGTFAGTSVTGYITSSKWTKAADCTLQAWWAPNGYTVTLNQQSGTTGHSADGTVGNQSVAYNTILPTISGTAPTAANGYAFMGFYTSTGGGGEKIINANLTWVASVEGYTNASSQWIHDGAVTLYAYYKKAEITGITFTDGAVVAPSTSKTVTAVISPTPTGTTTVCWRVLYSNDNPMDPQPSFSSVSGNSVSFTAPAASGMYKMEAVLHLGSGCSGDELSTYVANFQVAGDHTVTVQYKCGDDVIAASTSVTGKPLEWTEVVAHDIFGYTYSGMTAGDGVTLRDTTAARLTELQAEDATIVGVKRMKAVYDGKLTINYTKKKYIFLDLSQQFGDAEWTAPHVYFYKAAGYWDATYGAGATGDNCVGKGAMTNIDGTNIWYYDFGSVSNFGGVIAFTKEDKMSQEHFYSTEAIYRGDYTEGTPVFVPYNGQVKTTYNTSCDYYNAGYWVTYLGEKTGYTLRIKNNSTDALIKEVPFTSEDKRMAMTAVTDLEASHTYKFEIMRDNGKYYKNNGSMTYTNRNGNWKFTEAMSIGTIVTTASGDYTFTLSYADYNSDHNYELRVNVTYPVAAGNYRLIYKDDVQTKFLTSANIANTANSKDTVSFFVRPAKNPTLYKLTASVAGDGAVTWDTTKTNLITDAMLTSPITKDSVYNFNMVMDGEGALSVGDVKGYTGNFYIRTDAANNKWDNYRASDHMMTYSEYSEKNSDYSHYFMAFVENGTNVKCVIANDYSPCISDTMIQHTYRGGDADHVNESGFIQAAANIRFMWNKNNNAVYRAYLARGKNDGSKFLVLAGTDSDNILDPSGNALSDETNNNHTGGDHCMQFVDNENWIYEANVKIVPSTYVKLTAFFHGRTFYYKGDDGDGAFDEDHAIKLMDGDGDAQLVRVLYDFKTDRLVAAWMPSGEIEGNKEINADVMFVREHQGDIAQITFKDGDSKISEIKTAYAVLRFNKWTLNNKSKASGHAVLDPGASRYERDLFYVSFPFRVAMNEVFGFGKYGQHWIIEYYDGEARAANGFWADTPTYWKYVTDRKGKFFEPNQGYIIALDLDELGESSSVWDNGVENVELYFPSYGTMGNITNATVVHTLPSHAYDPAAHPTHKDDRSIADSHWNVMSVPTYVNTSSVAFANTTWTATRPSFLYEWNSNDNSLTPRSGSGYTYHAMHAYMVQYEGDVTWTSTSVTPSSVVARRTYAEAPSEVEFRLELSQNEQMTDQTFVRLSNDEEVSAEFVFGEDMSKEFNKNKANIYTMVSTMIDGDLSITETAGNTLPMSDQTTVVPVGVKIATDGDYTFAIPDGTSGVGVTLIDNETGVRTSLSALDYTINLPAGTYDERFVLEISPIKPIVTGIESISDEGLEISGARKVLIDNILYIVKDGKMFDAQGRQVK